MSIASNEHIRLQNRAKPGVANGDQLEWHLFKRKTNWKRSHSTTDEWR
jgi:hypothetical protein